MDLLGFDGEHWFLMENIDVYCFVFDVCWRMLVLVEFLWKMLVFQVCCLMEKICLLVNVGV